MELKDKTLKGLVSFRFPKAQATVAKLLNADELAPHRGRIDYIVQTLKAEGDCVEYGIRPLTAQEVGEINRKHWVDFRRYTSKRMLKKNKKNKE